MGTLNPVLGIYSWPSKSITQLTHSFLPVFRQKLCFFELSANDFTAVLSSTLPFWKCLLFQIFFSSWNVAYSHLGNKQQVSLPINLYPSNHLQVLLTDVMELGDPWKLGASLFSEIRRGEQTPANTKL